MGVCVCGWMGVGFRSPDENKGFLRDSTITYIRYFFEIHTTTNVKCLKLSGGGKCGCKASTRGMMSIQVWAGSLIFSRFYHFGIQSNLYSIWKKIDLA